MNRTSSHLPTLVALLTAFLAATLPARADLIEIADIQDQPQMAQQAFMANDALEFDGPMINGPGMQFGGGRWRSNNYSDQMLTSQIQQALQTTRPPNSNVWTWRDSVEDRLVSFGKNALAPLKQQLPNNDGYQRDALQVAIFRLENLPLYPKESLQNWADRYYLAPSFDHATCKFARVMDVRDAIDLRTIFPHHLFYIVENAATRTPRVVVALASDGMVQPLPDDPALTRFVHYEAAPQITQVGKERVAAAAALLAASRITTIYKPDRILVDGQLPTLTITLDAAPVHQTLSATFSPQGPLQTLTTGQQTTAPTPTAPIVVPTRVAPPPAMPE